MALYKGSNKICDLYYHGVAVAEIYKGNILVWTKDAAEYLVTVSQAANGTITAAPMQGPAGTLVTLSNTPNAGYQLTYYTVNGNQIQGNSFTLSSDSTISGLFTAVTYTVTIGAHANGSLSANPMSGVYGTTVTLTGTPNAHYELDYYSVNGSQIQGNTFTLTQDSNVAATFKQSTYTVTIGTHTNGTLSASPASGVYGTTITLSGTPNSGYTLDYYTVGGSRITGNTFTLTGNTTVTAVYKSAGYPVIFQTYFDGHSGNNFNYTKTTNNMVISNSNLNSKWSTYSAQLYTVASSDLGTNLPSGYVGKKYFKYVNRSDEFKPSIAIPTTYTDWTLGYWWKNTNYKSSLAPSTMQAYNCLPGGLATTKDTSVSSTGSTVMLACTRPNGYWGFYPNTQTSYTVYNGGSQGATGGYYADRWFGKVDLSQWHYMAIYYNASSKYIERYIDGVLFDRYSNASTDWASTSVNKTKPRSCLQGYYDLSGHAIMELTLYSGKYVSKPTAPIVPA